MRWAAAALGRRLLAGAAGGGGGPGPGPGRRPGPVQTCAGRTTAPGPGPAGREPGTARDFVHGAVSVGLVGATAYFGHDAVAEALVYRECVKLGLRAAGDSAELRELLGDGLVAGHWYDASVQVAGGGKVAVCTFPVSGSKKGSEIGVRAVRGAGGWQSPVLHHLLGPGTWEAVKVRAVTGMGGGLPKYLDLAPGGEGGGPGSAR